MLFAAVGAPLALQPTRTRLTIVGRLILSQSLTFNATVAVQLMLDWLRRRGTRSVGCGPCRRERATGSAAG